MKKRILVLLILLIIFFVPFKVNRLKDGGTIIYKGLIYEITKIHSLNDLHSDGYEKGLRIRILGINIYDKVDADIDYKKIEENMISCIENKLNKYINSNSKELLLSDITNNKDKIEYFKGITDGKNSYIMFKEYNGTYEYEVMKDFDLYFINKYDVYQRFDTNYGMTILIHTENNDLDANELVSSCYVNPLIEWKTEHIPLIVINELKKTTKIVFSGKEINDKKVINKLIDAVSNSSKIFYKGVEKAYLCDGPSEMFMYDENNKLIDILYVYHDGKRLIPKSITNGGCEYFTTKEDIRKIIEEGTNIKYHNVIDYSEVCASALELIYEDKDYKYYLNCIKSNYVLIHFSLNNKIMKLKYALNNNYISPDELITYNNLIYKKAKN